MQHIPVRAIPSFPCLSVHTGHSPKISSGANGNFSWDPEAQAQGKLQGRSWARAGHPKERLVNVMWPKIPNLSSSQEPGVQLQGFLLPPLAVPPEHSAEQEGNNERLQIRMNKSNITRALQCWCCTDLTLTPWTEMNFSCTKNHPQARRDGLLLRVGSWGCTAPPQGSSGAEIGLKG